MGLHAPPELEVGEPPDDDAEPLDEVDAVVPVEVAPELERLLMLELAVLEAEAEVVVPLEPEAEVVLALKVEVAEAEAEVLL